MIKEIKYNGYTVTPSDYECEDGDLDMASNLVQEDGALQPILPPLEEFGIGANYRLVFIHKVKPEYQYILFNTNTEDNKLYRTTQDRASQGENPIVIDDTESFADFHHVDAVGNTLIVFTESQTVYYLWKGNTYQKLGNHLPDVNLSFGLVGRPRLFSVSDDSHAKFHITFDRIYYADRKKDLTEANKTKITEQVMAKVNKFVKEQTIDKGRFMFPFFVRYALRLYDGTLACHSAPILMCPSTKTAPVVMFKWQVMDGGFVQWMESADCDIMLVAASMDYKTINFGDYGTLLSRWSDIVKSVDVFISKPIYSYDQDGKIASFYDTDNLDTKMIGKLYWDRTTVTNVQSPREDAVYEPIVVVGEDDDYKPYFDNYAERSYKEIYTLYFDPNRNYPNMTFHMPEFSEGKVRDSIANVSTFYKLCSLTLQDIESARYVRKDIEIEETYLNSLLQREVMTDDYQTHDMLTAKVSYNYNNRLNLAAMSRKLYHGFGAGSMFAYANALTRATPTPNERELSLAADTSFHTEYYTIDVYIKEGNETYKVSVEDNFPLIDYLSGILQYRSFGCWLFYPSSNAYKAVIYLENEGKHYTVDLKAHDFLNGAYGLLEFDIEREGETGAVTEPYIVDGQGNPITTIEMPNKIYTSEVNNPFFFPVTGINTVGTGKVIGISTAAKALSEGQFGQFPLYAFSTEGVWAMEVSDTGTYKTRQPITRDVCINEESITQLDNAVLFATDRGIMILSGSTSTCISDEINDETPFNVSMLPQMGALLTGLEYEVASIATTFRTFLMGCRMIYDYVHQRVVVYNPEYNYAYVYSIKSKHWTTMPSKIIDSIPSYPQAYAVSQGEEDNMLVDLSQDTTDEDALKGIKGVVITRPFKLDYPDALKTINTIIQRGYFDYHNDGTVKKVQQVLYGSRDLFNWYPVFSSQDLYLRGFRGTPYKYFRLALICNLDKDETLVGCTVQYEPRLTNKPR